MRLQRLRGPRVARSIVVLAAALCAACVSRAPARASVPVACPPAARPQDTVWLVSTRTLGSCHLEANVERLKVWRYDHELSWVPASLAELTATDDPEVVTVVNIHGNRIPFCDSFTSGWRNYRKLVQCAGESPVRFVIWSWPSDKQCGPVNDARIKAARTNADGYYLAWFLQQIHNDVPVSLWGHSFGARIATGALHLLGGGKLCGRELAGRVDPYSRPMHAVLMASAVDHDWLLPGHTHGRALSHVDAMLLVNNSCDRLLARYRLLYHRRSCHEALGYVGLAVGCLPAEDRAKVRQIDACCQVGKQHVLANYLYAPNLMAQMRSYLLFERRPAEETPNAESESDAADAEELPHADAPIDEAASAGPAIVPAGE